MRTALRASARGLAIDDVAQGVVDALRRLVADMGSIGATEEQIGDTLYPRRETGRE